MRPSQCLLSTADNACSPTPPHPSVCHRACGTPGPLRRATLPNQPAGPRSFCSAISAKARRTMQQHFAVKRISVDERMGIFAAHRAGCCQHADDAGFSLRGSGLDGGHRSHKRHFISLAQFIQRNGGSRVAGNHNHIRLHRVDQFAR